MTFLCPILLLHLVSSKAGKKRIMYCNHLLLGEDNVVIKPCMTLRTSLLSFLAPVLVIKIVS